MLVLPATLSSSSMLERIFLTELMGRDSWPVLPIVAVFLHAVIPCFPASFSCSFSQEGDFYCLPLILYFNFKCQ